MNWQSLAGDQTKFDEFSTYLSLVTLFCPKSSEGAELLAMYGKETNNLNPWLTFVPHVVINDRYVKYHDVRWNLKSLVCSEYQMGNHTSNACSRT